jgi:diguanylate cyclase (GGDEF)-like protein
VRHDGSDGGRERPPGWSVRAHFAGILLLATALLVIAGLILASNSLASARDRGRTGAEFQSRLASGAIAEALEQGQTAIAGLAGLDVRGLLAKPSACTLNFTDLGVFPAGHLDLVQPSGRVVCSSVFKAGAPAGASQKGAEWLTATAPTGGLALSKPFTDGLTGQRAVALTTPIKDSAGRPQLIVALVLPLPPLSGGLAHAYAGPRGFVFTVTDGTGQVLSASKTPDPPAVPTASDRWLQSSHEVAGTDWRVYAAVRTSVVLGPTRSTLKQEAALGLGAFVVLLLLLAWLNRRIARPVELLAHSVARAANELKPEPLSVGGPAEIRALAGEFNTMMATRLKHEEQLRQHALHDPLTGVATRALLLDRTERELSLVRTTASAQVVLAALDIDDFKAVNSNHGYRVGDAVLIELARRIEAQLEPEDTLARLGGDEFVVLHRMSLGEPPATIERLLARCFEEPFAGPNDSIPLSASVGLAVSDRRSTAEELARSANLAMYAAKQAGGNSAVTFTEALGAAASDQRALENDLREAQARGELSVVYQPLVSIITGEMTGVEALLRWHHPRRGAIAPSVFIPIAESTGLIGKIGLFVLREACQQNSAWAQQGHSLRVSVNVSGHQLLDPDFPNDVAAALFETSLPPSQLCLELTESVLMDDTGRATEAMAALKSLGICLSIDDFGTGYSSLAYLRHFPVDEIKIDGAFIQDLAARPDDPALVAAMVAMGHALGLHVVAEGVEQDVQAQTLRTLGCRSAQGYLFSTPRPPKAMTEMLERRQDTRRIGLHSD